MKEDVSPIVKRTRLYNYQIWQTHFGGKCTKCAKIYGIFFLIVQKKTNLELMSFVSSAEPNPSGLRLFVATLTRTKSVVISLFISYKVLSKCLQGVVI